MVVQFLFDPFDAGFDQGNEIKVGMESINVYHSSLMIFSEEFLLIGHAVFEGYDTIQQR